MEFFRTYFLRCSAAYCFDLQKTFIAEAAERIRRDRGENCGREHANYSAGSDGSAIVKADSSHVLAASRLRVARNDKPS